MNPKKTDRMNEIMVQVLRLINQHMDESLKKIARDGYRYDPYAPDPLQDKIDTLLNEFDALRRSPE